MYNTTPYKLVMFLHIFAVIVAMAPAFVWPVVSVYLRKQGKGDARLVGELSANNTKKVHGPALVIAGILGFGLVGMSKPDDLATEGIFTFGQAWVGAAIIVWLIMTGLVFGMMLPAEKRVAQGDEGAEKIVSAVGGVLHLLLAIILFLMVFKPGIPAV